MDHYYMLREIAEVASEVLNEREMEFVDDVSGQLSFSPKQKAWIELDRKSVV